VHIQHCFSVRLELVSERNTACQSVFSRGRKLYFVPKRPIQLSWRKTSISWKESISVRRRSIKHIVSLWELNSFFEKNTACPSGFVRCRNSHFVAKRPIHVCWRNCGSLNRKPSMLEAGASSTFFPCENWVFERNTACSSVLSISRNAHFVSKRLNWTKSFFPQKKTIYFRSRSIYHIVPQWELFVFDRKTAYLSGFSRGTNTHFVPNRPIHLSWRNTNIYWKKSIYVRTWSI
jgi:hypothetical protein